MTRLKLGGFSDEANIEGRSHELNADEFRAARLDAARRNPAWTEIDPPVVRERWLVDATTDRLYRLCRGDVFSPGSAAIITPETALAFYVDDDGAVVLLERVSSPSTWTEYLEKHSRRQREREHPTPTRIRIRR